MKKTIIGISIIAAITCTLIFTTSCGLRCERSVVDEPTMPSKQPQIQSSEINNIPATDVTPLSMKEESLEYSPAPKTSIKPSEWTIEAGDTLWKVAEKVYGNGLMYPYLMELNDKKTDTVLLGEVVKIEYFDSDDSFNAKLKECNRKIIEWSKSVPALNSSSKSINGMSYVGKFFVTGYDAWCAHCCGGDTSGVTASGKVATVGRTVATSKQFPMGTKLYVEGYGTYVVEDRGCANGIIDIATDSHEACGKLTKDGINVYIVK